MDNASKKRVKRKTLRRALENRVWAALRVKVWKVPRARVMAEYEVPEATLRGWIKESDDTKKQKNPIAAVVEKLNGACLLVNSQTGWQYSEDAERQLLKYIYDYWRMLGRQKSPQKSIAPSPSCSSDQTDSCDGSATPKRLRADQDSLASKRLKLAEDDGGYQTTSSSVEAKPDETLRQWVKDSDPADVADVLFGASLLADFQTGGRYDDIERQLMQYIFDG